MQIKNLSSPYILTADIGGSHITAAIYDAKTNTILNNSKIRAGLISNGSAADILASWSDVFQQVSKNTKLKITGSSVAMPGPFDYGKGISYIKGLNKYEALYGMNIKEFLADLLKLHPQMIRFRNDAESTIAGEVLMGAGKEYREVIGVTLGTGFGSAYSIKGITEDINLGSEPYKETIADDYFSTRWFLKRYMDLTGIALTGGVKELVSLVVKNSIARSLFNEFAENMGEFLVTQIEHYQPEALIICGNIAKASELFVPQLTKRLSSVNIKTAQLGENAPLIGAAAMFSDMPGSKPINSATNL
ncbi:MAG TPA: ROK family protein [Mucilaginibacter sp.]